MGQNPGSLDPSGREDAEYLEKMNIPHIRRFSGLRAIAAVACNGPVWFHDAGEEFDAEWVEAAGRTNGVEVRVTRTPYV